MATGLVCEDNCAGISWDFEVQQLTFSGGLWGGFFALGLCLSMTAATSNVDSWRMFLEITCLRISTSKLFLLLDFGLASIQCIHFCLRTYTQSLSIVGFVLESLSAVCVLGLMIPFWGFAHCEGILSGFYWMLFDRAIPDCILIGSIVSLPVAEHEGRKTWFAPSWLAALHLLRSWTKLLRVYKVNFEMFRNQIIDGCVTTGFKVYFMAMMMLSFENLGEPQFLEPVAQEKWNTISSIYFILTSVTTVGFGDIAPMTSLGRLSTVFAIYFGLTWLATVAYRSLQILAVNQTGGGFFEPVMHSKYIVVVGNPTALMLRNFLAEIFHPDHSEDSDDLHVSVILSPGHPGMELVTEWLRQPENIRMLPRIHIFQGTALSDNDLSRVTISAATCVFILPNLLCSSVMQEDTENIIRMMAVQKWVPKVRFILLLLRAENRKLLTEAHMDSNVTTVAFDQFKLEMAGKSCMVHGSGPLLSNLCKSIAIEEEEDDEDGEAEHKPQWKKDFERGCGLEVYEVELSRVYAERDATFIEVVVDIIEQTGGLVYLVGLVESRADSKKVIINPGPTFKIKQALPGFKIMGIFLASDREAIMQCDVGMVFLGRRERISMEEGDVDREDDLGDAVTKMKVKEDDVPEMNHVSLKAEHKAAALHLARVARRHQRSLKPLRPPLKRLAVGGHIIVLAVGSEKAEDLRLGIEHFVKPLRQNVIADEMIPVVVVSAIQPRDWFNVENVDQVYFLQGSPTSLLDLQRANFTGASAIFITNVGAGQTDAEKQESWTVDFEVICCTRLVESQLPVGSPTLVLSDIVVDSNHPFLPLPGLHGQQTKEVHKVGSKEKPHHGHGHGRFSFGKRPETVVKRPKQKVEEYFVQPRFAAGRLFAGGTTFASLAANTFYNPTLIDLVSTMVTTHIRMVKLPHSWEGKSYFELFDFLLWKEKLLAIGIYRTAEVATGGDDDDEPRRGSKGGPMVSPSRRKSIGAPADLAVRASRLSDSKNARKTVKVSFVYTAPPGKETAMMPGDKVICFECGKDA